MVTLFYDTAMGQFFIDLLAKPQGSKYVESLFPAGHYLAYLGVLAAFVLPNMGALSSGNYALETVQDGMYDFVSTYSAISGKTSSTLIKNLFWWFTMQQGGYCVWAFSHSFFLALMGAYDANLILTYVTSVDENNGSVDAMTPNQGLKGLLFGVMLGAAGYLGGIALSNRSDTILAMVGLNGYNAGTSKYYDSLDTIDTDQPLLYYLQQSVQQMGPLFYVVLIEIAVITSAFLAGVFLTV